MYKINNNSSLDVSHLTDIISHFMPYNQKQLGWNKPVSLFFQSDHDNANKILGKTAQYDPDQFSITIFVDGRHPKDILRSLSHELVHHNQNCLGQFDGPQDAGVGYAQRDPHLRTMEREAYEKGNIIFRDFEDLIKTGKINIKLSGESKMSLKEWKNNELNGLLMKKWGLLKEERSKKEGLEEGCPPEGHEGGEELDISAPGMEVHVDDISNLPPEEAFAAGIAAARDAIDGLMGGDVPPEGEGPLEEIVTGKPLTRGKLQPRAGHEPPDLAFKRATGYKNCEDLKAAWWHAADEFDKVHSDPHHQMSMAYPQLQAEADRLDALMKEHCSDVLQKDAAAWDAWSTAEDEKQRGRDVRRAAEKYYTDMAEGNKTSLTLDEAKDIARKIFERIRKESK